MKKNNPLINALIGLVAIFALFLFIADSDNLLTLVVLKAGGCSLFYLCSGIYEVFNDEEETV